MLLVIYALTLTTPRLYAQSAAPISTEPISLDTYRERLAEVALLLDAPDDAAMALAEANALLASTPRVRLASGDVVTPTLLIIFDEITAEEATEIEGETGKEIEDDLENDADATDMSDPALLAPLALQRVQLLIEQIDRAAADNTAVRLDALQSVFERAEFVQSETIWQRLQRWFFDLLASIWPDGGGNGNIYRLITWLAVIAGGLLVAFLLSYWLQGLIRGFVTDAAQRYEGDAGDGRPLTALESRQQAAKYAQHGNYRDAVRSLYLSALLSMEESGVVRYDRSLTNREVLRQLTAEDTPENELVEEHLRPVVDTFDAVWYGVSEPDAETFESYEREIDGLADAVNLPPTREQDDRGRRT